MPGFRSRGDQQSLCSAEESVVTVEELRGLGFV